MSSCLNKVFFIHFSLFLPRWPSSLFFLFKRHWIGFQLDFVSVSICEVFGVLSVFFCLTADLIVHWEMVAHHRENATEVICWHMLSLRGNYNLDWWECFFLLPFTFIIVVYSTNVKYFISESPAAEALQRFFFRNDDIFHSKIHFLIMHREKQTCIFCI